MTHISELTDLKRTLGPNHTGVLDTMHRHNTGVADVLEETYITYSISNYIREELS